MVSFSITKAAIIAISLTSTVQSISIVNNYFDRAVELFQQTEKQLPHFFQIHKEEESKDDVQSQGINTKPVPGGSPIEVCDNALPQLLTLEEVIISPNPPEVGANLTFTAKGKIDKTIVDGAYVEVDVRYGFIKLIHQTYDICEEITKIDLECPIEKGEQIIKKIVEIPDEVPPGKYIVNARAFTKDDEFITCLTATIEFPYKK
ncbi:NPC2 [Candida pseudojiufengensis]|uniref:NPC2 n=1 Tax=Candida pseudojiufengensis TaxID=497109 RepID=UPI0022241A3B|nr:NPC2 [Candida pseudojiufengensis]KAI5963625.1 NPC2 [Candida pseudojiufengensis]